MLSDGFTVEERGTLHKLLTVAEHFRGVHPEAKVRWLSEILSVDLNEGESVREYARALRINYNVASVDLLALGPMLRNREPGLDLVRDTTSIEDLRKHEVRLTGRGRALVNRILKLMGV